MCDIGCEQCNGLGKILCLAFASNDRKDGISGSGGHPRKEDGARAWRHNDSTGYLRVEIAPPPLYER